LTEVAPQIDLLTAAWKQRYFLGQLARAVAGAQRQRQPLALIHVDVDDLQEQNDQHGQASLDEALSWLASRMANVMDGRGPIGRLEGGAFATFLPAFTLEPAVRLAEQLRRMVPRTAHASPFGDYRLTISVGVAALRRSEPWGNLLEAAENACRKAKQGGRDVVVHR
jgi:diguanylate cyclase (GGDEF)-like protein